MNPCFLFQNQLGDLQNFKVQQRMQTSQQMEHRASALPSYSEHLAYLNNGHDGVHESLSTSVIVPRGWDRPIAKSHEPLFPVQRTNFFRHCA